VEQQPPTAGRLDRPVAPHGRGRQAGGQDLLGDLLHGDLVVVAWFAARHGDRRRPGHHRGDQQRCHVLGDAVGIERSAGDLGHGPLHPAGLGGDVPGDRCCAGELEETSSRGHDCTLRGHRCCLSGDSPRSRRGGARVEIWDPGLGTRATGIRPTTQRRAPRGPRADNDGEEQPLANAQAAERASCGGRVRLLDSPHRVPTAPHLVTVAMNLLPRVSWGLRPPGGTLHQLTPL
jgi:hypothetical protein